MAPFWRRAEKAHTPEPLTQDSAFTEVGNLAVEHQGGLVTADYDKNLRGANGRKIMREMGDHPIVGSGLGAMELELRRAEWQVQAAETPRGEERAEWFETVLIDMSHSWDQHVVEAASMFQYGWAWFETVYKRRQGVTDRPGTSSGYSDGTIGWRKFALRPQHSLDKWLFDEEGGIDGMVQRTGGIQTVTIPIEKAILHRTTSAGGNPEGRPVTRRAYIPWFEEKRIREYEGIGIERDLAGLPVARIPADTMHSGATSAQKAVYDGAKEMVQNIRVDEQHGVVLPSARDKDSGEYLYTLELLTSPGSKQIDVDKAVRRRHQEMVIGMLTDFLLLGHEKIGTQALASQKDQMFTRMLDAFLSEMAEVYNRHAIPTLMELNGWERADSPRLVPSKLDATSLTDLVNTIETLARAGAPLFPNDDLMGELESRTGLPLLSEFDTPDMPPPN